MIFGGPVEPELKLYASVFDSFARLSNSLTNFFELVLECRPVSDIFVAFEPQSIRDSQAPRRYTDFTQLKAVRSISEPKVQSIKESY